MVKILIVDDEPLNVKLIAAYLYDSKYTLVSAYNSKQAIEILEQNPDVQLILLDRMMPDMDGLELAKLINTNKNWKNIPIIMQTAAAEKSKIEECVKNGITHYLIKPFDQQQLLDVLHAKLK